MGRVHPDGLPVRGLPRRASQPAADGRHPGRGNFGWAARPEEREYGYRLDETLHGSTVARRQGWFEVETRQRLDLSGYRIDRNVVTNADYARFVAATRAPRAVC